MINRQAENNPNRKETPAAKNRQNRVTLILVVLLILMFLALAGFTVFLFLNYKSISEEMSQMKNNDTEIMKSKMSELEKRYAEDTEILKSQLNELKYRDAEDTKIMKSQLSELENRDAEDTQIMKSKLSELENRVNEQTLDLQRNVENVTISRSCESDWVEFEGHCYFFSVFELIWTKAEMICLNRGSHLVIINGQAEQTFLESAVKGHFFWIGLTDLETEGTFMWIDGTELSYTSWEYGEPDNFNNIEHCTYVFYDGWNDFNCNETIYVSCEKNLI